MALYRVSYVTNLDPEDAPLIKTGGNSHESAALQFIRTHPREGWHEVRVQLEGFGGYEGEHVQIFVAEHKPAKFSVHPCDE